MDPNATLTALRDAVRSHDNDAITELWDALDGWLSCGGFKPAAWRGPVEEALDRFADMVNDTGPGPWNAMSCTEAEVTADLLRVTGRSALAEFLLDDHSEGDDDENDQHYGRTN